MSLQTTEIKSMKDLLLKEEFLLPKPGSILGGEVISVSKANIILDLGSIGIGIVYPGEFYDNPDRVKSLKPGDKVSAMLIELENEEGYRELSLKAAQITTAWQDIKERKESGEVLETTIININKGGLIVEISGIQGFLPLSQLSSEHYPKVDGGDTTKIVQALQKFKGQKFSVKVLDFNEAENKLIVSERAIQEEAVKEELSKYKVGDLVKGQVTEVTDFGAFVKLSDTLDGLIHSSEIDWKFIEDPREVLHSGDTIEAKIISLDGGRVSLSLKALKDDPWVTIDSIYQVGQKVKGKISKIRNSGAFVELPGNIIGFVPVAELGGQMPQDALIVGKEYDMAIVHIDAKDHKLTLTLDKKAE
ncbi:S1 RNA-binding domain-containing protein [Candidatus Parcubacteria bacterium]|nr:S1 RNA-binding domain-containing protein [Candidatus Parcubacteria bacterium]